MLAFAQACEQIAATGSKLEKIRIVAAYLAALADDDLAAAARYFTGNPFAAGDQRSLAIGWRTIVDAATATWDVRPEELGRTYREHGDLGSALAPFVRPPATLALFSEQFSPAYLKTLLDEIAAASGKHAGRKRLILCERILGACRVPIEAKYAIKIMTGELRIGLREGLIVDAVAAAFDEEANAVRRALMAAGDIGAVAVAAKHRTLHEIGIGYGAPIAFMLASPVQYGSAYRELSGGQWIAEPKLDGIRAQLHKDGATVRIFSRTLGDVTHSYPEVELAARALSGSCILDGELIAQRNGRVLPFRNLQARLQRKDVAPELLAEIPVAYACFDVLALDDTLLVDEPLAKRRAVLEGLLRSEGALFAVQARPLPSGDAAPQALHALFDEARAAGHEGLMLKRTDSPYFPGKRGKWWLKLKRELSTLDVVVVAVEWGHGKRANVLSDYTFAVKGDDGTLQTIGKAYSGLTDAEIAEYTPRFLEHRLPEAMRRERARRGEIPVEPKVVLEVAFDVIQESSLHESGFSLRFPRIVRIRDDKPPEEIDSLARVREIYREMLAREAGPPS